MDGTRPNKKTKNLSVEECVEMFLEVSPNQESVSHLEPNKRSPGPYQCSSTGMLVSDEGTQTEYCKYLLPAKIVTMLLKNEVAKMKTQLNPSTKIVSSLSYEAISQDSSLMKHFVGLTSEQFRALHNFLNSICPLDKMSYWYSDGQTENKIDNNGQEAKCSTEEMLYVCLFRLRRAYIIKSLAVILSTPNRTIKETLVWKIFTTYIQLLYKVFRDMQDVMFPTRGKMRHFLPKVFKTMKDVHCVVDCTEFHVQTSRNDARQGNTYSSYKHANTFKCLIAVIPNGGACFVSDLFEGDIDDVQIFRECGIMKHIRPHDVILADRGFIVQDLLHPLQADVKNTFFLERKKQPKCSRRIINTKNAKARIHVEQFNERVKSFRLVGRKIPLSLAPLATQMVVVACGLVNFQGKLCK